MKYPVDNEQVNYEYNDRMLLNRVFSTTSTYVDSTSYDPAGRIDLRTFGNTTQTDYVYYPWNTAAQGGRLQYLKSGTAGSPTSLQNLSYGYDAVGNITSLTNTLASETNSYGYDTLNRLTSWTLNSTPETYTYDSASGNLDVKAGVDLNYNDVAHVHAVTHIGSTQKYCYDQNGNQTRGNETINLTSMRKTADPACLEVTPVLCRWGWSTKNHKMYNTRGCIIKWRMAW
jgi:YD repeat-containing protein